MEVEAQPAEPIRLAVEAIPEEVPSCTFDDPTLDLEELEQDDFTGEVDSTAMSSGMSSGGDYDDELEWMQTKRKNMVTWWLLFFGALGGVGYFALDFLNQQDSEKAASVVPPASVEEPPTPPTEKPEPDVAVTDGDPAELTEEPAAPAEGEAEDVPTDAGAANASTEAEEAPVEAVVAAPPPPSPPSAAPATPPPPAAPAAPARVSPAREIDRGWAKIDREMGRSPHAFQQRIGGQSGQW